MWRNSSKEPLLAFDIFDRNRDDVFTRFQIEQKTRVAILNTSIGVIVIWEAWLHKIALIVFDNSIYELLWLKMALILDFHSWSLLQEIQWFEKFMILHMYEILIL